MRRARSLWQTLVAGVDNDLAETVSRATTAVWRRLRRGRATKRPSSRRAPWLVGGAVAAAVLAGGALWPTASGVATEDPADVVSTPAPHGDRRERRCVADSAPRRRSAPTADGSAATDLAQVTGGLLDARIACARGAGCLATVVRGCRRRCPRARSTCPPVSDRSRSSTTSATSPCSASTPPTARARPQMVVILRRDEEWLLRDVYGRRAAAMSSEAVGSDAELDPRTPPPRAGTSPHRGSARRPRRR